MEEHSDAVSNEAERENKKDMRVKSEDAKQEIEPREKIKFCS